MTNQQILAAHKMMSTMFVDINDIWIRLEEATFLQTKLRVDPRQHDILTMSAWETDTENNNDLRERYRQSLIRSYRSLADACRNIDGDPTYLYQWIETLKAMSDDDVAFRCDVEK